MARTRGRWLFRAGDKKTMVARQDGRVMPQSWQPEAEAPSPASIPARRRSAAERLQPWPEDCWACPWHGSGQPESVRQLPEQRKPSKAMPIVPGQDVRQRHDRCRKISVACPRSTWFQPLFFKKVRYVAEYSLQMSETSAQKRRYSELAIRTKSS